MTTIAADQHSIAADGLQIWSGEIVRRDVRKIVGLGTAAGPQVFGFTGCCPLMREAINWFLHGALVDTCPMKGDADHSWTLLVIKKDFVGKISNVVPYLEQMSFPLGLGAGGEMATGAMLAGATPRRAVELVASRCDHTGGVITEINFAEVLG